MKILYTVTKGLILGLLLVAYSVIFKYFTENVNIITLLSCILIGYLGVEVLFIFFDMLS